MVCGWNYSAYFGSILVDNAEANKSISATEKKAGGLGTKLGGLIGTAAKVGVGIAAGVGAAGAAMMAAGKMFADSAASAQAMNSQFTQVFGSMETDAQNMVESLGKDFGMLPNRIKPAYTSITSMMKGFGMSTEESMKAAGNAMTYASDAAAFYDTSVESASGALTSFLKGNTSAAESIGIFATVSGMATFASEKLGLSWNDLDEAGKQIVRLKYVETMQEASGAMGQAARESKSLENVTGNLKQAWEDMKAKVGAPLLEPIIESLMSLIPLMQKGADWLITNMPTIQAVVGTTFNIIKTVALAAYNVFNDNILPVLISVYDWVQSNMPTFQAIFNTVFGAIWDIASQVWHIFTDNLLPILKALYEFIEPTFPIIGETIKAAFGVIVGVVQTAIDIFDTLTSGIKTAIDWLKKWNNTEAKDKDTSIAGNASQYTGQYANGTDFAPGGRALVGERGPEIVELPRGSKVIPNHELGGTQEITVNIPVVLEGKTVTTVVSKIQLDNTRGRARAIGVSI